MGRKRYGRLYEDAARLVLDHPGLTAHSLRLFIWLMTYAKSGDRLKGKEAAELNSWLAENAPNIEPKDVQIVQFSYKHAANDVFNGQNNAAVRQVERLTKEGIIHLVSKGSRGHASLYLVCNKYTLCVPNNQVDKYTSNTEKVHIRGEIGTHPDAVTSGDETYPDNNPDNYPESASATAENNAAQPLSCPRCHSTDSVQLEANGLYTCSCGNAWRA